MVRNVRRFVAGDHGGAVNFTPALRLKDIDYALRLANKLGAQCRFGSVASELYRKLVAAGHAGCNESRIIDTLRD